ncbi:amino acid ABC transporter permease [Streptomyces genisteinicus]|uniref:Amino acid ABC transporter permease n=1 Tax=Streptomyces genisteinicus TaxID=2768068 RepID=A0A7H0HXI7_9ACTN|nr:amino acid ABC transporter permease [Streptomyces genisteinicus]QNP65253.1 amino acid ABC transporter permease [Streptomyces genisteinicus]
MTDKFDKTPADGPPARQAVDKGTYTPPEQIKAIPVRHWGRWVSAVIVVALLGTLIYSFSQGDVNWGTVGDLIFDDRIVRGMGATLLISVLSMLIGLVLGILFAVMRLSKNPVTGAVAWLYIWFFRGTPVYVQLLLWFNLALIFPILNLGFYKDEMVDVMTPFMVALLGLGLNEGAYMAEIVRAGIQSVDEGQTEASHALGMSNSKTMRRIVLPQAMRVIVPPTGNEFINLLKTSSLVSAVQYTELLRAAQNIGSTSFAIMETLLVASVWYLALTSVFSVGQYYVERHYARGSLRQLPPTPWQRVKANLLNVTGKREGAWS